MKITTYELGEDGKMKPVEEKQNLLNGQLLRMEGYDCPRAVIVGREESSFGLKYETVILETYIYRTLEAWSIKDISERKDGRIQWYAYNEFIATEELKLIVAKADQVKEENRIKNDRQDEERKKLIENGKIIYQAKVPASAKALIVAQLRQDESDSQTDITGIRR